MGTSPLVGQYDNLQDSQSGKTVDGFSLPPACIAPSDAMKINQRKKKFPAQFQVDFSVFCIQSMSRVNVFSNREDSNDSCILGRPLVSPDSL